MAGSSALPTASGPRRSEQGLAGTRLAGALLQYASELLARECFGLHAANEVYGLATGHAQLANAARLGLVAAIVPTVGALFFFMLWLAFAAPG